MKLGEKIKLLRTEQELTQPQLAEKAGIEQSYLSKLENDKGIPSFDIINRISLALEMTGMELIDSLSQSYVEDHLAHIPEVTAQYAAIRHKQDKRMKQRFILAAFIVVLGLGLFLSGAFSSESLWYYESDGVVKEGEMLMKFYPGTIMAISERGDESAERLKSNKDDLDKAFILSDEYRGDEYIRNVDGGRRLYVLVNDTASQPRETLVMGMQAILGIMLIVTGLFTFLFNIRFKSKEV